MRGIYVFVDCMNNLLEFRLYEYAYRACNLELVITLVYIST